MAVEGMGERVRNHIFNKNLTREQLMRAARNVFEQRYLMLKLPMVISGQETQEDMDEFLSEIQEMLDIRNSMGATTAIMMSFTPLVVYDQTALRWLERKTAWMSFKGEKSMMYFAEKLRPMDARAKYHAKGPGTFIEQLMLDTHRQGTKMLVDVTINKGLGFTRNFNLKVKDLLLESCDELGIDYMDIFRERDLDEILPSDVFEFVTDETIEAWKEMHRKKDWFGHYCLKTQSNEGHCYACKTCPSAEAIKNVVARALEKTTFEEVMSKLRQFKPSFYTRIVIETKGCCQIHNKEALAHYITSLFLRRDSHLRDNFHSIGHTTSEWTGAEGQKDWFTGKCVWDMKWICDVGIDRIRNLIDDINNSGDLVDCKILAVRESSKDTLVKRQDIVSYIVRIPNYSAQKFQEKIQNFNGQVRVFEAQTGPTLKGFKFKKIQDNTLKDKICCANKHQDLYLGMVLPIYYSPYATLASITGMSYEKLVRETDVIVLDHMKDAQIICNTCDKGQALSLVDNKLRCPYCANKKVVYQLTRIS